MATYDYGRTIWIHGNGIANTGDWPEVYANFGIYLTRQNGSSTVTWDTHDWDWHYDNGYFWYMLHAAIAVNPADPDNPDWDTELWTILEKSYHTESNNWWGSVYTAAPGPHTTTCTSDKITLYVYVKAEHDCCNGSWGNFCYPNDGHEWVRIGECTYDIDPYETFYTVSYNTNGGSGSFPNQTKSSLSALTLHNYLPTYPININYYDVNGNYTDRDTSNRALGENSSHNNTWKGTDNNYYGASGTYSTNANCTMNAIWRDATFTTRAISDQFYTVTYNYNGGTGSPASVSVKRSTDGYATSYGGAKVYNAGTSYTTSTNVSLYPRYGNATLTSLPSPTRVGYQFKGWYADSSLTIPVTTPYTVTGNTTLYARWLALPLHKFQLNGTWDSNGPYVWRFNGTSWEKVAHVYKYNGGNSWTDLSL